MVRKKWVLWNRYLGVGAFTATLLFAGVHQKFVLEPITAATEARRAADFVTENLQSQLTPVPESKKQEVSLGIDALLQGKLQALLAASQTPPPPPPRSQPITKAFYQELIH